jgi:hypothetical protein
MSRVTLLDTVKIVVLTKLEISPTVVDDDPLNESIIFAEIIEHPYISSCEVYGP